MSPVHIPVAEVFPFLLILSRVTGAALVLPGLGSHNINTPIRILFCMTLAFLMTPLLVDSLPQAPEEPYLFFTYIVFEALIGLFIGTLGRVLISSLEVAGSVIGFQTGLMNAFVLNPVESTQSSLPAGFLSAIVLALIFISDIHHLALQAIYDSYQMFHPGEWKGYDKLSGDFSSAMVRMMGDAFMLGTQIATPIIILSMLFFTGMGLLNRLMPQLQVFFVIQPFQIFIGLMILSMLISSACMSVIERLAYLYTNLWGR